MVRATAPLRVAKPQAGADMVLVGAVEAFDQLLEGAVLLETASRFSLYLKTW